MVKHLGKYILLFSLCLVLFSTLVYGHSWYPYDCCHDQDCFPIKCEDILEDINGNYIYDGLTFTKDKIKNSLDAMCHACIGKTSGMSIPRCLFIHNAV